MKTAIIALSATALIAAAPAAFAQGVSTKTPTHVIQHKVSKKRHPSVSGYARGREMQAKGSNKGYPRVYAPAQSTDYTTGMSSQAGGGGGGGGGGGY